MTFRFEHHNQILAVLESLDSDILRKGSAYFGSGTFLAFDFEEYQDFFREQHDVFADLETQIEKRAVLKQVMPNTPKSLKLFV